MFCPNCGVKYKKMVIYCENCGMRVHREDFDRESMLRYTKHRYYRPVFYKYFFYSTLLNIYLIVVWDTRSSFHLMVYLVALALYLYSFSLLMYEVVERTEEARWWKFVLLTLIPFVYWLSFIALQIGLKTYEMWDPENEHRKWE
jgi:hypothetical protein